MTERLNNEFPFVTIVMPVYNEERFVADTLNQLVAQDYPVDRYEIIVADGMSEDNTRKIVTDISKRHPQVHLFDNPRKKSGAGRNVGFKNGRGDIFLVVDGHCYIPDAHLLKNTVDCLEKSGADCLGRPQPLDPPNLTRFQRAVALARASWLGHGGDSLIYGEYEGFASPVSNGATYKKNVFDRVGYVDENFDACEDVEFNYRVEQVGLTCYTSPKLTVRYYPRENLRGLFRQMVRYGTGRFLFIKKHREAQTVNQLIPAAFVVGLSFLILSAVTGLFDHRGTWAFGSLYGVYFLVVIVESIRIGIHNGLKYLLSLPSIFLAIHIGLGWGFARQTICLKQQES